MTKTNKEILNKALEWAKENYKGETKYFDDYVLGVYKAMMNEKKRNEK